MAKEQVEATLTVSNTGANPFTVELDGADAVTVAAGASLPAHDSGNHPDVRAVCKAAKVPCSVSVVVDNTGDNPLNVRVSGEPDQELAGGASVTVTADFNDKSEIRVDAR